MPLVSKRFSSICVVFRQLYSVVKTKNEKLEGGKDTSTSRTTLKRDYSYADSTGKKEREDGDNDNSRRPWWKFWGGSPSQKEKVKPIDQAIESICGSFAANRINSFKGAQRTFLASSLPHDSDKSLQKTSMLQCCIDLLSIIRVYYIIFA